jgi:adenylylsulfate kinase-like enzyme
VGEVAALFAEAGCIAIAAFISPREDRDTIRQILGPKRFVEVFVNAPLEVCERRDVKDLMRRPGGRAQNSPAFLALRASAPA